MNNSITIMSIMSYYANQIFDGTKGYEFRKSPLPENNLDQDIYIYSARDDKAIIGTFKVRRNLSGNIGEILKMTGYDQRSDKDEIISYFNNSNTCYALEVYDVKRLNNPITLKELRSVNPNVSLPQYYTNIKSDNTIYNLLKKRI